MANDRTLSAEEQAVVASTLVDLAETQQDLCNDLLRRLDKAVDDFDQRTVDVADRQEELCDGLLRRVDKTADDFDQRTKELSRDMPIKIAQQAAKEAVQNIAQGG